MKPRMNFCSAFFIVALVFGFTSCSYDNDLQPPKRLVEANAINNPEGARTGNPVQVEQGIVENHQ